MDSKKILIGVAIALAIALIWALSWGFGKNTEVENLKTDNTEIKGQLGDMTLLRDDLAREVDSLANEYGMLSSENVELSGRLAASQDELAKAQSAVSRAKRNSAGEINDLRAQIAELTSLKSNLQSSILAVQAENDSLRMRTGVLETDLAMSQEETVQLTQMTETMNSEIKKLTLDNFKASAFQVSPEVKSGNATAKSSRARRLNVSFDLSNVPAEYQGVRPLYLVVTDDSGTPIQRTDYINTAVTVGGQRVDIMAVEARDENIAESQRITFIHELENKLDAGFYRTTVYTDIGILGASTFRLR